MPLPDDRQGLLRLAQETERVLTETSNGADPTAAQKHAKELFRLGEIHARLGEAQEAERLFDESASASLKLDEPVYLEVAAMARIRQSSLVMADGRFAEALEILDNLVEQHDGFPKFETFVDMRSSGLEAWLWLVEEAGDNQRLYDAAGIALDRLDPAGSKQERVLIAEALVQRGRTADKLGYSDEAIEMYRNAVVRCEQEGPEVPDGYLLEATGRLAVLLARTDRDDEASTFFAQLIERFGTSAQPGAAEMVAGARLWLEAQAEEEED
jgi:tetratricopeptide (TPR) repeat protein